MKALTASVKKSTAGIPNRTPAKAWLTSIDATSPITMPNPARIMPRFKTNTMTRCVSAPKAMRIPTSRVL